MTKFPGYDNNCQEEQKSLMMKGRPIKCNMRNNNILYAKASKFISMAYYLHAMKTKKGNDQKGN